MVVKCTNWEIFRLGFRIFDRKSLYLNVFLKLYTTDFKGSFPHIFLIISQFYKFLFSKNNFKMYT